MNNPIVPIQVEKKYDQNNINLSNVNELSMINSNKKIVSKFVEITTKTITTYEDGSTKTTVETENHTYK